MKTVDALAVLRQTLAAEPLPRAAQTWTGTGITILAPEAPEPLSDGFRPRSRSRSDRSFAGPIESLR